LPKIIQKYGRAEYNYTKHSHNIIIYVLTLSRWLGYVGDNVSISAATMASNEL